MSTLGDIRPAGNIKPDPIIAGWLWLVIIVLSVWDLYWKGRALWKSAQKKDKVWFIALLILNTVGILPIFYIFLNKNKHRKSQN